MPEVVRAEKLIKIDTAVDQGVKREVDLSTIQGKMATNDFDVFLCYHGIDNTFVKHIGEQLKNRGLLPWLDDWELRPGLPWQRSLEAQIENIKTAAVFVGANGIGPWLQQAEAGNPLEHGASPLADPTRVNDSAIKKLIIKYPLQRFLIKNFITYLPEEGILQITPQLWHELHYYEVIDALNSADEQIKYYVARHFKESSS